MGLLVRYWDQDRDWNLCTIRKPLVWHPDLVPSVLLKDHSNDNSEFSSCNDSRRPDDDAEMSINN